MNNCYRKLYPCSNGKQNKQMLCWVVCWLHGHVVCDGNVMVGILGGGWLGGMGGGMEREITHQCPLCPH